MLTRFKELIVYRDLIWNLVARDLKVRYKSFVVTALGFLGLGCFVFNRYAPTFAEEV